MAKRGPGVTLVEFLTHFMFFGVVVISDFHDWFLVPVALFLTNTGRWHSGLLFFFVYVFVRRISQSFMGKFA